MRFYLSHSIRGKAGANATGLEMKANCEKAILIANLIRNAIPSIEIYCPGEHEDFVQLAFYRHYLTEKQILEIDCAIIDSCEGVIYYVPEGDELQGGRKVEYDYAYQTGMVVYMFNNVKTIINQLTEYILRA